MLRRYINFRIACHPALYIPLYRKIGQKQDCLINNKTEIVIEGFPRSANTFAVVAFRHAQNRPIHIAHHLHVPAHFLEGIRMNLPVLILIRKPDDVVKSYKIRNPELNVNEALRNYIGFYSIVAVNLDRIVIGKFEDVISCYDLVIHNINKKFNLDFALFNHTPAEQNIIFDKIRKINAKSMSIPTKERKKFKAGFKLSYREKLMVDANCIYKNILNHVNACQV